jgi:hypothetical protein
MNDDRSLDKISLGCLVSVSAMLSQPAFLYQLIENVFDPLSSGRCGFKFLENPLQVGAAIGRSLDVLNEIFRTRLSRLRLGRGSSRSPLSFHSFSIRGVGL